VAREQVLVAHRRSLPYALRFYRTTRNLRPGYTRAGAGHVQAVGDHLLADPEFLGCGRYRGAVPDDPERGILGEQERARQSFNALVHQYLIPGAQVGAKVTVDKDTGEILDVFSVYRPVMHGSGCLWCNGLISPARLQEEALTETERREQCYVEESTIHAPSVITLNAVACAHAVDDYLFSLTGLLAPGTPNAYRRFLPRDADFMLDDPRHDPDCTECGPGPKGRLGAGSSMRLPTR